MQVKFRGQREGRKIVILMSIPTEKEKAVISIEMPNERDWRADMECYDKILRAYEERWSKASSE